MKILRRYELRSIDLSGTNQHVSWHLLVTTAERRKAWWQDWLYSNDGSREIPVNFYVRRVGD